MVQKVARAWSGPSRALVVTEHHVPKPMQAVLEMPDGCLRPISCPVCSQQGDDLVASFALDPLAALPHAAVNGHSIEIGSVMALP